MSEKKKVTIPVGIDFAELSVRVSASIPFARYSMRWTWSPAELPDNRRDQSYYPVAPRGSPGPTHSPARVAADPWPTTPPHLTPQGATHERTEKRSIRRTADH